MGSNIKLTNAEIVVGAIAAFICGATKSVFHKIFDRNQRYNYAIVKGEQKKLKNIELDYNRATTNLMVKQYTAFITVWVDDKFIATTIEDFCKENCEIISEQLSKQFPNFPCALTFTHNSRNNNAIFGQNLFVAKIALDRECDISQDAISILYSLATILEKV